MNARYTRGCAVLCNPHDAVQLVLLGGFFIINSSKLCVKGVFCLCTHRTTVLAGPQMVRSSTQHCAVLLRALLVASLVCIATVRYL